MMYPDRLLILLQAIMAESADGEALDLTKLVMMLTDRLLILLQAIVAESADGEALDVELAASGFGQHYQEVNIARFPCFVSHCSCAYCFCRGCQCSCPRHCCTSHTFLFFHSAADWHCSHE